MIHIFVYVGWHMKLTWSIIINNSLYFVFLVLIWHAFLQMKLCFLFLFHYHFIVTNLFYFLLQRVVTALDKTWHPEHFFCAQCGSFFGPEGKQLPLLSTSFLLFCWCFLFYQLIFFKMVLSLWQPFCPSFCNFFCRFPWEGGKGVL